MLLTMLHATPLPAPAALAVCVSLWTLFAGFAVVSVPYSNERATVVSVALLGALAAFAVDLGRAIERRQRRGFLVRMEVRCV